MRGRVHPAIAGAVVAAVALVATACYPPSQDPVEQAIPPGGRAVATSPVLTEMRIEDASDDLSTILYSWSPFLISVGDPIPSRFAVYDDDTGTTTDVPAGQADYGTAALSPDERSVVFSSNDPALQVGPIAANCRRWIDPWTPGPYEYCQELYVVDLDTGEVRQLTGLDGSSPHSNAFPTFSEDGAAIDFRAPNTDGPTTSTYRRLHLDSGVIEDAPPTPPCCEWSRGTREIVWDDATTTLTSFDTATGEVTTLWEDPDPHHLVSHAGDGRFVVVSRWETDQIQVFRLIDTDTGTVRPVSSQWISDDGGRFAVVQVNVAPDAIDRLILAPLAS